MNDRDLKDCFNLYIRIPEGKFGDAAAPDFARRKRIITQGAFDELQIVVSKMGAALHAPYPIPAGKQNEAVANVYRHAFTLRASLHEGANALRQSFGRKIGQFGDVYNSDGSDDPNGEFLRRFERELNRLIELARPPEASTAPGRQENKQRVIALARCAAYYEDWTGNPPSDSRNSPFAQFSSGIFEILGFENVDDMRTQIRKVLDLKSRGVNLETWAG